MWNELELQMNVHSPVSLNQCESHQFCKSEKLHQIDSALQEHFCPSRERLLTAETEHIQAHLTFYVFYVLL